MRTLDETAKTIGMLVHEDALQNGYSYALVVVDGTGTLVATNMDEALRTRIGRVLMKPKPLTTTGAIVVPRPGKG